MLSQYDAATFATFAGQGAGLSALPRHGRGVDCRARRGRQLQGPREIRRQGRGEPQDRSVPLRWGAPVMRRFSPIRALLGRSCPVFHGTANAGVSCSFTGATLTFGTINIFANSTTSGNATLTCNTVGQPLTFYACLSIGTGTGGTTASNPTLAAGSHKLPIH